MKNSLVSTIDKLVGLFVKEINNSELKNFDDAVVKEIVVTNPTKPVFEISILETTSFYEHSINVRLFTSERYKALYHFWNFNNMYLLQNLKHLWIEHIMKKHFIEYSVSFSIANGTNIEVKNTYSEDMS